METKKVEVNNMLKLILPQIDEIITDKMEWLENTLPSNRKMDRVLEVLERMEATLEGLNDMWETFEVQEDKDMINAIAEKAETLIVQLRMEKNILSSSKPRLYETA